MPISLHAAFVPSAIQMLDSTRHIVDTGEKWCTDNGHETDRVLEAKIYDDMFPFTYQVKSVAVHTAGALSGVRHGLFQPDLSPPPTSFERLRTTLSEARSALVATTEQELEDATGKDMRFEFRDFKLEFTVEDFLLSFSQPNFYFHATTAYDILRMLGVPVGKRDFTGRVRIKS